MIWLMYAVWVVMNNYAFGTIAGLEMAHFGTRFGTVFRKDRKPFSPDFVAIARTAPKAFA